MSGLPCESWLLRTEAGESGPYTADDVARLLAEGACDWTTEVIRDGLSMWRTARRDALLVMAVARVSGLDCATQRIGSMRALLHPDLASEGELPNAQRPEDTGHHDTWVDARPSFPELRDTPVPSAWPAAVGGRADERALAVPDRSDGSDLSAPPFSPSQPAQRTAVAPDARLDGQLRSTLRKAFARKPEGARRSGPARRAPWLVTPWVALVAFIAGVAFALAPARLVGLTQTVAQGLRAQLSGRGVGAPVASPVAEKSAQKAQSAEPARPPLSPPRRAVAAQPDAKSELSKRTLPTRSELRAELDRLSPLVRRCVRDPSRGVELDLVIAGVTGHVEDVRVATSALTPGAIECIREVFVDFHVPPFVTPELRLAQRYRW